MDIRDIINIENLVRVELEDSLTMLRQNHNMATSGCKTHLFSADKDTEVVEIERHIDAFETVLGWYGGKIK